MKPKFIQAFMDTAFRFAELSYARRLKVGAIVVKDDKIISIGYNGMPAGWDNNCENRSYNNRWVKQSDIAWHDPITYQVVDNAWMDEQFPLEDDKGRYRLVTKAEVLHAESNAVSKLAKTSGGAEGSTVFITHSPCIECAKLLHQAGVKKVYFGQHYRDEYGIKFLQDSGISVEHVPALSQTPDSP